MKKKNKTKGYTLLELIVVMAIVAILAGIAVPLTIGFITSSQNKSDRAFLNSVYYDTIDAINYINSKAEEITIDTILAEIVPKYSDDIEILPYNEANTTLDRVILINFIKEQKMVTVALYRDSEIVAGTNMKYEIPFSII